MRNALKAALFVVIVGVLAGVGVGLLLDADAPIRMFFLGILATVVFAGIIDTVRGKK